MSDWNYPAAELPQSGGCTQHTSLSRCVHQSTAHMVRIDWADSVCHGCTKAYCPNTLLLYCMPATFIKLMQRAALISDVAS
jgi:hypothetical protein